jgi:hypothetical protein
MDIACRIHRPFCVPAVVLLVLVFLTACANDPSLPGSESGLTAPVIPDVAKDDPPLVAGPSAAVAELPWEEGVWDLPPEGAHPVGVWIPSLAVAAPVRGLGLHRDGTLEVPDEWDMVGWYTGGPRPGAYGTALLAGHTAASGGPAAFSALGDLWSDALVHVVYDDGFVATFVVTEVEAVAGDAFAFARSSTSPEPGLHLITLSGQRAAEALVVHATLVGTWENSDPTG